MGARILCVADSVDAMPTDRAYRKGIIGGEILSSSYNGDPGGTQFDSVVANVAIGLLSDREFADEMRKIE